MYKPRQQDYTLAPQSTNHTGEVNKMVPTQGVAGLCEELRTSGDIVECSEPHLAKELRAAASTIESLQAELEFSRDGHSQVISLFHEGSKERDALKDRVAKLEEALKPFAKIVKLYNKELKDNDEVISIQRSKTKYIHIAMGELRQARNALEQKV